MKPDLLECPFCGSVPEWFEGKVAIDGGLDMQQLYRVKCRDRTCLAQPLIATYGEKGYLRADDLPNEIARGLCINGWNRRQSESAWLT